MNSLKNREILRVSLLNFEGGLWVPLLNFEGGPEVPRSHFEGVPGPRVLRSRGPGPTFTPCRIRIGYQQIKNKLNKDYLSLFLFIFKII